MRRYLPFVLLLLSFVALQSQTTVTFKPNATIGQDAPIWMLDNDCVANWLPQTSANTNFGDHFTLIIGDWTWNANGCGSGTIRSVLKFEQLSTIPTNATITSAILKLYGTGPNQDLLILGNNSYYNGSTFPTNEVWIEQITSSWDENTITWNTQPTTTTTNRISIAPSTTQYYWNYVDSSSNFLSMVQQWVSNPESNQGIMLKLQNEQHYRSMTFASSNYSDSTLHPELIITYIVNDPCENYTADLGIDFSVCQGDSVRLWNRTSDTGTCQWSINNYEGDTLTFVADTTQTIYLIMLDSNGCTASASVVVNVQNPPQITFSGNTIICAGGSTTLTAIADVPNCTFAWNNGSTGNEITVSPNIPTTYSVTATTQPLGCSSTAEVSVNIQSPQVTAGNDVNIC
ncbi:MAG: DNRLRE domain-containing protein, partial [Bacteroidales bacterium]|nr:DNRLRE domain-containing protein [Bacteroidales bacterium]